jgi:hypothetical protein
MIFNALCLWHDFLHMTLVFEIFKSDLFISGNKTIQIKSNIKVH